MSDPKNTKFASLRLEGWRQFGQIDIELHPHLTVITGANGAGKSTLLNIFSSHFNYTRPYLSTPRLDSNGGYSYVTGFLSIFGKLFSKSSQNRPGVMGELAYTNSKRAAVSVPESGGIQYQVGFQPKENVAGFHVPSHRRLSQYQQVGQIPTQPMLPQQAYDQFNGEILAQFQGGHTGLSPIYRIKEALLSMAVFGPQTRFNQGNHVLRDTFTGFSETLLKILPEEIGFIEISIRSPDVVLITKSGEFLIDSMSGGLMSLVDLAWQIYMFSVRDSAFVVTIDEPENHLHPSMQRVLMGNLIKTFPNVQFIVATHSPFIVSAVRDARVYALRHIERPEAKGAENVPQDHSRFVSSVRLDSVSRAGTASQILRDVLGLSTTYPEWVAEGVDEIIRRYRGRPFNEELLSAIRKELDNAGYGEFLPDVTSALAKE